MLKRTARKDSQPPSVYWVLTGILLAGLLLRTIYLTQDRFHADEALYAGWALRALDGDPFLIESPVDKPPLFLYTLAASMQSFGQSEFAARLPNLAASTLGIALAYCLVKHLYGHKTALWMAWFFALSPFDILFARTAFTDPLLVMWIFAALCAVSLDRWFWTGVATGLAFATKQHAILLIPLVIAVGCVRTYVRTRGRHTLGILALKLSIGLLGYLVPFSFVTWWDSLRWDIRPGYWQQSAVSYGGLSWSPLDEWGARLIEWLGWTRYLTGAPLLYLVVVVGGGLLLIRGWQYRPTDPQTWLDTVFLGYGFAYLLCHIVFRFSIWDRYLLPLALLASLFLARTVVHHTTIRHKTWAYTASVCAICLVALLAGGKAAVNGYPVGGEHWAYQGLDQAVSYLRHEAAPDAVLYHHWLRWHYTFYLYDTDFELRWWQSGEHLLREARRTPEREQYIVLPDWRSLEPEIKGITLELVYETHRKDHSISFRVYRIRPEMDTV